MKTQINIIALLIATLISPTFLNAQEIEKKETDRYPVLEYPPGYYKGAFFISLIGGRSIAPTGTFIRHEKTYDKILSLQIRNGDYINPITSNLPNTSLPPNFDAQYTPGYTWQIELEYGTFSHFGFGFAINQFSIEAKRQDIMMTGASPPIVSPVPLSTTLFNGTSAVGVATFHPIQKAVFDPYAVVRLGAVGFTGEAHPSTIPNPNRLSNSIENGLGLATGAGLGINIHISRAVGIKAEGFYHRQYLKSDQFSTRTLNTFTAQIGIILNATRLFPD